MLVVCAVLLISCSCSQTEEFSLTETITRSDDFNAELIGQKHNEVLQASLDSVLSVDRVGKISMKKFKEEILEYICEFSINDSQIGHEELDSKGKVYIKNKILKYSQTPLEEIIQSISPEEEKFISRAKNNCGNAIMIKKNQGRGRCIHS